MNTTSASPKVAAASVVKTLPALPRIPSRKFFRQ
jgi:hypothetical protein